jgi:hypothetical protein
VNAGMNICGFLCDSAPLQTKTAVRLEGQRLKIGGSFDFSHQKEILARVLVNGRNALSVVSFSIFTWEYGQNRARVWQKFYDFMGYYDISHI